MKTWKIKTTLTQTNFTMQGIELNTTAAKINWNWKWTIDKMIIKEWSLAPIFNSSAFISLFYSKTVLIRHRNKLDIFGFWAFEWLIQDITTIFWCLRTAPLNCHKLNNNNRQFSPSPPFIYFKNKCGTICLFAITQIENGKRTGEKKKDKNNHEINQRSK